MDHAEPEAAGQERSAAPGPLAVLDEVAAEAGHVVPAVVVDDEQPAAGPEHAVGLGQVGGDDAAERRPDADDRVGRGVAARATASLAARS